jgi:hypothetical protein
MLRKLAIVSMLMLVLCSSVSPSAARGSLQSAADEIAISVATDKTAYDPGEPVQVAVSARNITDQPVTLSWGSACQSRHSINGRWLVQVCLAIPTSVTIPVSQTHTWTIAHPDTLDPGFYVVVGQVIDYGDSAPRAFGVGEQVFLPVVAGWSVRLED